MKVRDIFNECYKRVAFTSDDIQCFLSCFNMSESELAREHLSIFKVDSFKSNLDGIYSFEDFRNPVLKIISVRCGNTFLPFDVSIRHLKLKFKPNPDKDIIVEYASLPYPKQIDDESDYDDNYKDVLVHATLSEYFLIQGDFKRAEHYESEYRRLLKLRGN